jgi:hypothetical protein
MTAILIDILYCLKRMEGRYMKEIGTKRSIKFEGRGKVVPAL